MPSSVPSYLLSVRGGGLDEDYYDDEYDEDSDYDFDDDDFAFDEDDFGDGGLTARLLAAYEKTPPFTKAYLTASAAVSAMRRVLVGGLVIRTPWWERVMVGLSVSTTVMVR